MADRRGGGGGHRDSAQALVPLRLGSEEEDTLPDTIDAGVDAANDIIGGITGLVQADTFDPAAAGKLISGIGAAVAIIVPPPAGLIAGGVISLAGGVMGLFADTEPSNQDVLNAMQKGFEAVQAKLAEMDVKLDTILEEVNEILEILVKNIELKTPVIEKINQDMEEILDLQAKANGSVTGQATYIETVHKARLDHQSERGEFGAVSTKKT